jgi:hypothetical protein
VLDPVAVRHSHALPAVAHELSPHHLRCHREPVLALATLALRVPAEHGSERGYATHAAALRTKLTMGNDVKFDRDSTSTAVMTSGYANCTCARRRYSAYSNTTEGIATICGTWKFSSVR